MFFLTMCKIWCVIGNIKFNQFCGNWIDCGLGDEFKKLHNGAVVKDM